MRQELVYHDEFPTQGRFGVVGMNLFDWSMMNLWMIFFVDWPHVILGLLSLAVPFRTVSFVKEVTRAIIENEEEAFNFFDAKGELAIREKETTGEDHHGTILTVIPLGLHRTSSFLYFSWRKIHHLCRQNIAYGLLDVVLAPLPILTAPAAPNNHYRFFFFFFF